jgi:carboxypeptidase family protein
MSLPATRYTFVAVAISCPAMFGCGTGKDGTNGTNGVDARATGTISGIVKDGTGTAIAGAAVATTPASSTATTAGDGTFALSNVNIGSYSVTATKAGYLPFTLTGIGVIGGGTTNVSLVISPDTSAPGAISGTVTDTKSPATPLAGVVVKVQGQSAQTTTAANGTFTLSTVSPGPVFVSATAPNASFLDTETRQAVIVQPNATVSGVTLVLSARPSDAATYVGMAAGLCSACHANVANPVRTSAHNRSLTRIQRDANGHAVAGAFARMLNATLTPSRVVMVPLVGTVSAASNSPIVTGVGTAFLNGGPGNALQVGDEFGYTPVGLGWTKIGNVQSVDSDTQVTLSANATFAPGVTTLSAAAYSVKRLSRIYTHMLPEDANDIVAPAWPGVKATNPNYDANDPCVYGNAPIGQTCAAGGNTQYPDGQVNVYFCNLKDGVTYLYDEYVQKFGGRQFTCSDGAFYDGLTPPAVPLVHIAVIYGGQGDKDGAGARHPNMGVFKQRFQAPLADIAATSPWSYTSGKSLDSLTLPIQVLESGDKVSGGYKMNGYHPTEQKFPGESWTQRTRTFSHACAGCHNVGLNISWDMVTVTLPFGRDGQPNNSPMHFAAVKSYGFIDENLTCEHCHGPGSEHLSAAGGRGHAIINPKYITAEAERQLCGKCHSYDDGNNAKPVQDYGFEFPWNSDYAGRLGNGDYVPGVYQLTSFIGNWGDRLTDDEAFWEPASNSGALYGQAHRQQYLMLSQSHHTNNSYEKETCTSCHSPHSTFLGSTHTQSATDQYSFSRADFRNDVMCLSCHAGGGPLAGMPATGSWASLTKDDVANIHVASGGTVTKNNVPVVADQERILASQLAVSAAVGRHMLTKANMIAQYNPLNDAAPVGRCTSCHMPRVAKSGGYVTGVDNYNNKTIIEGDQGSHIFTIVWPWQSNAMVRGGPTFQSGYYGQMVSATNVKYDLFGFMPNSCSSCHAYARTASLACPDSSAIWPSFWPHSEHRSDPYWSGCFTSITAP